MRISVRWEGLSDVIDSLHGIAYATDDATKVGVMQGARVIQDLARANTRAVFVEWTGRLSDSITTDGPEQVAAHAYRARAYPQGGEALGTPYGRIQELGGTIVAHNPTGFLWWEGFRADGTFGLISKPSVTLKPRPYLAPALESATPSLGNEMFSVWGQAVEV